MSAGTLPYWLDAPYEARPPLAGRVEAEVCVIGGGVGGLSCARTLAERGVDTIVLERTTVAGGASGRNGGFLLAGVAAFHNDARELYGHEHARRLYASTLSAQQEIYELAARLGIGDSVREVGSLRVAVSEDEAERVSGQVAALKEDGFPAELVGRDELPPVLRRRGLCACLVDHDAALHPARWYRALAGAAEQAGARIFEGTAVRGPVPAPGEGELATGEGSVRARHVVVAADGALPALVPDYEGRVRPRRLHMVASEPMEQHIVDQLVYPRWGFEYFQQRRDGRLLLGGFSDLDGPASYTDREEGSDGGLGAPGGLPARRARAGYQSQPPLGGRGRLYRGPAAVRRRGPGPAGALRGGRLLGARQSAGLRRRPGDRGPHHGASRWSRSSPATARASCPG